MLSISGAVIWKSCIREGRLKCPYFDPAQFHRQHLRVHAFRSQPVHVQHPEMSHLPGHYRGGPADGL
ncbi:hypothetical protein QQF64_016190 [Cirrhinus molitorella]|uniref:C2H2-type domain-containing protein n=1 Tax=Cirrhinus molitorella TaxID=172907 RepID=A0ABR3LPN0_9TELE